MDKTRVDDMLIEMIRPKIEEIEKKFSSGEPLTQDDINTLLLKSQYNHINHLDKKLDETVDMVKSLEFKFSKLESELKSEMSALNERLESKMSALEQRLESKMSALEQRLESKMSALEQRLDKKMEVLEQKIEVNIQKALNKNMLSLIAIIGFFFTLFKIIDIFAK